MSAPSSISARSTRSTPGSVHTARAPRRSLEILRARRRVDIGLGELAHRVAELGVLLDFGVLGGRFAAVAGQSPAMPATASGDQRARPPASRHQPLAHRGRGVRHESQEMMPRQIAPRSPDRAAAYRRRARAQPACRNLVRKSARLRSARPSARRGDRRDPPASVTSSISPRAWRSQACAPGS